MAVKTHRNGAFRTLATLYARQSGAWRKLRSLKVYSGGAWRQIASFVQPLTATASPASVSGAGNGAYQQLVTSGASTVTPVGGKAPYTYSWTYDSGDASVTINSSSSASTTFSKALAKFGAATANYRCTVTDADGSTAITNVVDVTLTNGI